MAIVVIDYFYYTVDINGIGYGILEVPDDAHKELNHEQQLELLLLELNYLLAREKHPERMRQAQEARRLQKLEEREQIIGFAATMSKILHREQIIGFAATMSKILHRKEEAKKNLEKEA